MEFSINLFLKHRQAKISPLGELLAHHYCVKQLSHLVGDVNSKLGVTVRSCHGLRSLRARFAAQYARFSEPFRLFLFEPENVQLRNEVAPLTNSTLSDVQNSGELCGTASKFDCIFSFHGANFSILNK